MVAPDSQAISVPAVRQKLHLASCPNLRDRLSLLRQATRQKVPLPNWDDEDAWIESHIYGKSYLSMAAYADLRTVIRKEKNEKWDFRLKVLGLAGTTLIGVIGSLIGLVAALKK
jgi:hypothetical protein